MYSILFPGLALKSLFLQKKVLDGQSNNGKVNTSIYLVSNYVFTCIKCFLTDNFSVENVPGLGASGYVESASDFKSVPEKEAAHGKALDLYIVGIVTEKIDFFIYKFSIFHQRRSFRIGK